MNYHSVTVILVDVNSIWPLSRHLGSHVFVTGKYNYSTSNGWMFLYAKSYTAGCVKAPLCIV